MRINKITKLSALLVVLVAVSIGLSFWESNRGASEVEAGLFAIENIDPIDRVVINRAGEVIDCRAFSQGFMINGKFTMDQNLLTVLAAVLQQVRVQRPLSGSEAGQIWDQMQEAGSHIEVFAGDQVLASYWTTGDKEKQNSYFAKDSENVYLVNLPGYTSYLNGLFELTATEWRSRTIFSNTWRSLMTFSYQDFLEPKNDFQINYNDPFFEVSGIQQLDSNNVMNYLQDLVSLKASSLVDTTYQGPPFLELTVTDIDPIKNQRLTLYGDITQPSILGKAGDQYFSFRTASLEPVIKNPAHFEYKQ